MVKHTQTIRRQPTNCLSVFDHFVKLALKGLMFFYLSQRLYQNNVMRYNCSRLFVAFGKTFVAFDCDEKLTQNVAQITM